MHAGLGNLQQKMTRVRMKTGLNGLKGKEITLITIVVMSATIILWNWEKTPRLTALFPPQDPLQLSSEILSSVPDEVKHPSYVSDEEKHPSSVSDVVKHPSRVSDVVKHPSSVSNEANQSFNVSDEEVEHDRISEAGKNHAIQTFPNPTAHKTERNEAQAERTSKQEENIKHPTNEDPQRSSLISGEDKNSNKATESKVCNYAKGKWVLDDKRPLYSGFHCKQWLSAMWACRMMQRTDFTYEKLRWQPNDCQMEEFEGSKFLTRMQSKTLAFVGDSLGRQQFQSLMCMVTGGKEAPDVQDVGAEYGLVLTEGNSRPSGWAYRFPSTNTTILYYWSASLCDIEPIDINNPETEYAMHLDRPPAFLRQYLHRFDVLVLNTGHHWNRGKLNANKWVMHVGGKPNTNRKIAVIWVAKNLTIHSIVSWVNSQLPKYPGLKAFYRSISPRHFFGGEWNTGGSCDNTTPMSIGKEILGEESTDQSAASAVKGTGVKLLDITALSQLRDEAHISRYSLTAQPGVQDCLHWCLPGVPDTWNELIFAQI